MSKRKEIARKSVIITVLDRSVTYALNFISRKVFLMTIGVGYLGLNSTLAQILGTLSVSELGIQAVIIYRLYKPLVDGDRNQVCQIMSVIRCFYHWVAGFIILASLIFIPFLPCFIHDVVIPWKSIYIAWIMMAMTTAASYTMNYNSTVIFADQKQHIYQQFHLVINTVITGINIIVLYFQQNYLLYLAVGMFNTLAGNYILLYLRRKLYPWIVSVKPSKKLMKEVMKGSLDVFAGRMAGYSLNSTSYMVISIFISTTLVGYVSNYTSISIAVGMMISVVCGPIQALVGNMLAEREGEAEKMTSFIKKLCYIVYLIGMILILLMALLIDDFVSLFYGQEYVLDEWFLCLLVVELYVTNNQFAPGLMLDAAGQFRIERNFYIISAIMTFLLCVIGALIIGVNGVLSGLLLGRVYLWWCRSYYCFKYVIKDTGIRFLHYLKYQAGWCVIFVFSWLILYLLFCNLHLSISVYTLFIKGIIIVLCIVLVQYLLFKGTPELKYLLGFCKLDKIIKN